MRQRQRDDGARPLTVRIEGAAVVVEGDLDYGTVSELLAAIHTARQRGRPLVLDVGGVNFFDSSGIATLIRLRSWAGNTDDALTLRHPTQKLMALLRLSGLARMFRVQDPVTSVPAPVPPPS
jgi:anti-anti-sigma factor